MTPERWEQIGRLYDAAKELESAARAAFLDQACTSDRSLRREVESLLKAEKFLSGFIAEPAFNDPALLEGGDLAGAKLGHYRLISLLGAGGMGEVYEAEDHRLGRKVAIKLLPSFISGDPDRLQRFELEARATGMLNHPNILTIYDVGEDQGAPYIVMEKLEGKTLREWIDNGMIPLSKAMDFAVQIARGLAAAHERGIVHRDLKPENIFVTRDGRLKILDFGLAKLKSARFSAQEINESSAVRGSSGLLMGTMGYMAPEQVLDDDPDHRVDIFAFGVILYEVLAGERPFEGKSPVETMRKTLKEDPPVLPESAGVRSSGLARIVHRCLEKRPEHRFHSANDLGLALEALISLTANSTDSRSRAGVAVSDSGTAAPAELPRPRINWSGRSGWIFAGFLALISVWFGRAYFRRLEDSGSVMRFSILLPQKMTRVGKPVVSPDGKRLAFHASSEGRTQIWVRPINSFAAQPLPGTENGINPFWAPDSRQIGFFADGKLKRAGLTGDPPIPLANAPDSRGGTWSRDGIILFVPHPSAGIYRVSASGGSAEAVNGLGGSGEQSVRLWPSFLPDGRHFICFNTGAQGEASGIYLVSLDGRENRRLCSATSNAVYAPPGYLLFAQEERLVAQPFDTTALKLTGDPLHLGDQIPIFFLSKAFFSVSETGILVHSSSIGAMTAQLRWYDRAGKPLELIGVIADYFNVAISSNGKRIASARLDHQTGTGDIWLFGLARGGDRRLTFDPGNDLSPVWSPDGGRLVWASNREGPFSLYQRSSDGTGRDELLIKSPGYQMRPTDWSRDGRFILYEANDPKTNLDLWILPLSGDRTPIPWAQTRFNESNARFSPDSRWVAWTSDESRTKEVYVQGLRNPSGRWKISTRGGDYPQWRLDGKELFYLAPDGKLMVVEIKNSADFSPGAPRELFKLPDLAAPNDGYTVAPDGNKILLITSAEENATLFSAILNWSSALER